MDGRYLPACVWRSTIAALVLALEAPALVAQTVVTTPNPEDGAYARLSRDFFPFTVGQTFTAPDNAAALTGFSLFLGYSPVSFPGDLDLSFQAYVARWQDGAPTGVPWVSAPQAGEAAAENDTEFPLVRRDFGVVAPFVLTPGAQYVVFLSTVESDPFDFNTDAPAAQNVGLVFGNPYLGGELVSAVAGSFAELMAADAWLAEVGDDLAFELRFADRVPGVEVPEPSSMSLLALALLAVFLTMLRRSRRRTS